LADNYRPAANDQYRLKVVAARHERCAVVAVAMGDATKCSFLPIANRTIKAFAWARVDARLCLASVLCSDPLEEGRLVSEVQYVREAEPP
jgi:hypothetical protein